MKNITNEIVKRFEQYLYEEERSDNTIEKYMRDIRFFREWLGGKSVDKSVVLAYKKELCEKYLPVQIASQNGHLCHIRRPLCDLNGGHPRTH